jgi:hypothetical protein
VFSLGALYIAFHARLADGGSACASRFPPTCSISRARGRHESCPRRACARYNGRARQRLAVRATCRACASAVASHWVRPACHARTHAGRPRTHHGHCYRGRSSRGAGVCESRSRAYLRPRASGTSRCARLRGAPLSELSLNALPFALIAVDAQAPATSVALSATATCADTPYVFGWSRSRPIKPRTAPRHLILCTVARPPPLRHSLMTIVSASFCALLSFSLVIPRPCSFAVPCCFGAVRLSFGFGPSFASPASFRYHAYANTLRSCA